MKAITPFGKARNRVRRSGHVPAAVDTDSLAGAVAVARHHHHHLGYFLHLPEPTDRNDAGSSLWVARNHLCLDQRWGNRVGRDALFCQQDGSDGASSTVVLGVSGKGCL